MGLVSSSETAKMVCFIMLRSLFWLISAMNSSSTRRISGKSSLEETCSEVFTLSELILRVFFSPLNSTDSPVSLLESSEKSLPGSTQLPSSSTKAGISVSI